MLEDEKHVEKGRGTPLVPVHSGPSGCQRTPSYVKVPAKTTEPPSQAQMHNKSVCLLC